MPILWDESAERRYREEVVPDAKDRLEFLPLDVSSEARVKEAAAKVNGELYGTDAGDFASEGNVKVFNANSGALLNTIPTGIIPGQVVIP